MTISITSPTSTLYGSTHTALRPNRQIARRIPLILDIIRRPLEAPIRKSPAASNLLLQPLSISAQFRIRKVLPPNFKPIKYGLVRHITRIFIGLFGSWFDFEIPPVGDDAAAKFVIMRVVERVVAVAAVDRDLEFADAVVY